MGTFPLGLTWSFLCTGAQGENGNPLPYSCLKKSHAQRNLEGYNPKGGKELATAEHKHTEENSRCLWETVIGLLLGFD